MFKELAGFGWINSVVAGEMTSAFEHEHEPTSLLGSSGLKDFQSICSYSLIGAEVLGLCNFANIAYTG
ncbi:hypothetical protein KY289_018263 [Solanum tuberosum]|nr:hypothetical protein KY289_018263 [Solanum tuberosum]